jgi:alpha-N-acetylglucosaminidase
MRPVLGAFAGFVPSAFATKYPQAKLNRAPAWANFAKEYGEVYQLDSTDPLFHRIGSRFIEVQNAIYGTDHIYSCDTFNEMNPATTDLTELTASSTAVYQAMSASDPDAIWLMQGNNMNVVMAPSFCFC